MGNWDEIMGKNMQASPAGAGISMNLKIDIPFSRIMSNLLDQVKSGRMPTDTYYAIIEQYYKILDEFRNVKL